MRERKVMILALPESGYKKLERGSWGLIWLTPDRKLPTFLPQQPSLFLEEHKLLFVFSLHGFKNVAWLVNSLFQVFLRFLVMIPWSSNCHSRLRATESIITSNGQQLPIFSQIIIVIQLLYSALQDFLRTLLRLLE